MGLDHNLIKELLFPEVGPGVFVPLNDLPHTTEDVVMITPMEDRFKINHLGLTTELTTDQCCEYFEKKIRKNQTVKYTPPPTPDVPVPEVEMRPVKAVLLLWDKSRFVPKEKKPEQEKRAQSNKYTPYPPGCLLIPQGIVDPSGIFLKIDANRLAISGDLFREFAAYLETYLIDLHTRLPFLATIYLNYDRGVGKPSEYILYSVRDRLEGVFPAHAERSSAADTIGEMDLVVNHYTAEFHGYNIRLYSEDGDHLPLLLSYLKRCENTPKQLWWILREHHKKLPEGHKRKNPDDPANQLYAIDVLALNTAVRNGIPSMASLRFPYDDLTEEEKGDERIDALHYICDANGTDYVEKKWLCHQFGWRDVVAATCKAWPELSGMLKRAERREERREEDMKALETFVYHLFDQKPSLFKSGRPVLHVVASGTESTQTLDWYRIELSQQKRFKVPSSEEFDKALHGITFNWRYWN
jgi:hypothetical protein